MFFRAPRPASTVAPAVALILALSMPGRAGATFIAGNLPGGTALTTINNFSTTSGFNVTGTQSTTGRGYAIAVKFTTGATAMTFDSAQLGLVFRAGTNAINLSLVADSGGLPLGTTLETIRLAGLSAAPTLVTATSAAHSTLAAGMSYWLVATPGDSYTDVGWMTNLTGQVGHTAYRADTTAGAGSWTLGASYSDASFAVFGSAVTSAAVPEPPSVLLCGFAALGLAAGHHARRRRRA